MKTMNLKIHLNNHSVLNAYTYSEKSFLSSSLDFLSFPCRSLLGGHAVNLITGQSQESLSIIGKITLSCALILGGYFAKRAVIPGIAFSLASLAFKHLAAFSLIEKAHIHTFIHNQQKDNSSTKHIIPATPPVTSNQCHVSDFQPEAQQNANLETMFTQEVFTIDLKELPNFSLFLAPNETGVLNIIPHLAKAKMPGLIVSTGTERSFFDLALAPEGCEGLVIVDIHPYVKAYVDFNTLLLRISQDMQDYAQLSALAIGEIKTASYQEKIKNIRTITEKASIPPEIKKYYLDNLEEFAKIYFTSTQRPDYWRTRCGFKGVQYYEEETLFNRLQQYARAGRIISKVGDISDLNFLDKFRIAILDISNISDYVALDIKTHSKPVIITTRVNSEKSARYASTTFNPLREEEKKELRDLLDIFRVVLNSDVKCGIFGMGLFDLLTNNQNPNPDFLEVNSCFFSKELLNGLKFHKKTYLYYTGMRWIDFSHNGNYDWWTSCTQPKEASASFEAWLAPIRAQNVVIPEKVEAALSTRYNSGLNYYRS